jgi:hypothetical protein
MAEPVWSLSVDLQARTATFQSGLADAARAARGSFSEIKDGAADAGRGTAYSLMEARHATMMLGDELGLKIPRALAGFISSLGPLGPALEAAFPLLALVAGAQLLIEHFAKLHEAGAKLSDSQMNFGTTVASVLNSLNDRLLEVGIRADELAGNHVAALHKQLELIDHQTMRDLASEFEKVSKGAETAFAELKASSLESFFQISKGSDGAKAALEHFKTEYASLLSQGKDKDAGDLLQGTLESAKKAAELMEARQGGHGSDDKELQSQRQLISVLEAQIEVRKQLSAIAAGEKQNDKTSEAQREANEQEQIAEAQERGLEHYKQIRREEERASKETAERAVKAEIESVDSRMEADRAYFEYCKKQMEETAKLGEEAGKQAAEHETRMAEMRLAAAKEGDQFLLDLARITEREKLELEKQAENEAFKTERESLTREIDSLNQYSAEYLNKKQALNNKIEELEKQHDNRMQQLDDQAHQRQLQALMQWESRTQGMYIDAFSKVMMGKESFAHAMQQVDEQIAESAIKSGLRELMSLETIQGRKRFSDARTAAADAFASAGNPILGAVEAAATFATVMSFNAGGVVPGIENFDSVHAMLTPGEGVLTRHQMEALQNAARGNTTNNNQEVHIHHHATYHVQAMDSDGVKAVLDKHGEQFAEHAANHLRRLNK